MASLNRAMILGRLGKEPQIKYTANGNAVCNLSVATSKVWNDNGEKKEKTQWHNIVVWGKSAENCNLYLSKGREVYVEGTIETRSYEDNEGKTRYTTEIIASSVIFIGGNVDKNTQLKKIVKSEEKPYIATNDNFASDDIPF